MGRFERRLFLALVLLSIVPTLVIAALGTRYLLSYIDRVSSPVLKQSAENSLQIARRFHTHLEVVAEAAAYDLIVNLGKTKPQTEQGLASLLRDTYARHRIDFIALCVKDDRWQIRLSHPEPIEIDQDWLNSLLTKTTYVESSNKPHLIASFVSLSEDSLVLAGFVLDPKTTEMIAKATNDLTRYSSLPLYLKSQGVVLAIAIALTVVVLLLLSLLVSRILARRIGFPIEQLAVATSRVAKGDLEHRITVEAKDEIADLVKAFNKMTEDLKKHKQDLIRAERLAAWRDIARRVAHEINNPLTPIQTTIYRLKQRFKPEDASNTEILKMLDAISRKVEDLRGIATRFGEIARLPEPKFDLLELNKTIEDSLKLFDNFSPRIEIAREMDPDLGLVWADGSQIKRAIENLIKNAIEAMPEGGRITIRTSKIEGFAVIEIADTGKGIPEDIRNKIFDPYFTTKPHGSGLGLAVVQKIVDDHKGRIEFETGKDGTTFRILLPLSAQTKEAKT